MSTLTHIDAQPYQWPYNGDLRAANTALVVLHLPDFQCSR